MATWKSDFSENEKNAFSCSPEKLIFQKPNNVCFVVNWETDILETETIRFRGALQKRIYGYRKFIFHDALKKRLVGYRKNILYRSDKAIFRIPKKMAFSWRTEISIFRKLKKRFSRGALKKRIFGKRKKEFLCRTVRAIFKAEKMAFIWRTEKEIFRNQKISLYRGALKTRFLGNRKKWLFLHPLKKLLSWNEKITFSSHSEKSI